jgi:cephalosporin hydroxylase
MIDDHKKFKKECKKEIAKQSKSKKFHNLSKKWIEESIKTKYTYHFDWLGRPIIQFPQDIIVLQQLMWDIKPDLVIETGIARGGSLIFISSMLELLSICGSEKNAKVIGIDIDIRKHNEIKIKKHSLSKRIHLLKGSSIDKKIFDKVKKISKNYKKIMVILDSNHNHQHVLEELKMYAPLVTSNSYCIIFDTIIDYMPNKFNKKKNWTSTKNPKTAIDEYLNYIKKDKPKDYDKKFLNFSIDKNLDNLIMLSNAPGGFLKRK